MGVTYSILIKAAGLAITLLLLTICISPQVNAGSYDVGARVDHPAPTQAAIIESTLDSQTVSNAFFNVYGTCEVANPSIVVSITRNGSIIGSTNCESDGTFALNVSLISGANTLIARSASVSQLYGPDSQPITVTLNLPPPPVSSEPSLPSTETPIISPQPTQQRPQTTSTLTEEQVEDINEGARQNLRITTTTGFTVIDEKNGNGASIEVKIEGGRAPYTITINWGDGSVESKVVDSPNNYVFKHDYRKAGVYRVTGDVRDALGAVTRFEYLITSGKAEKQTTTPASTFEPQESIDYLSIVMISAFGIVGLAAFLLGKTSSVAKLKKRK